MAKFCTECGKEIADGVAFCTECGAPAPKEEPKPQEQTAIPQPEPPPVQQQHTTPAQQPYQAQTVPMTEQKPRGKYGVVSTGAFFGLTLLFAIPVIGWLACLIMAFVPKNENIKHYARAMLIWILIGIVLCVALYFLFSWAWGAIAEYINEITDGQFSQFGDLGELFDQFKNGGFNINDLPSN